MIKGIKHIIFDLGGVILNIDYQLTSKAFKQLGVNNFDELYSQKEQIELFDELETGKIDSTSFYQRFNLMLNTNLTHQQIEDAWNAMLLDWPIKRLQLLQQLQNQYIRQPYSIFVGLEVFSVGFALFVLVVALLSDLLPHCAFLK